MLLIGDDTRIGLAVARSLGRRGIDVQAVSYDVSAPALRSRYITRVHRLPPYPLGPHQWVDALRQLIERHDFDLLIPCFDSYLMMLHRHRDEIGRDRLGIVNPAAVEVFTDKQATRQLAAQLGVPVARGRLVTASDSAAALAAEFGLPLVLKPNTSYELGDTQMKRAALKLADRGALEAAFAQAASEGFLVEAFFPGDGVGVSVLARKGEILMACQHRRLREPSMVGGSSSRVTEKLDPALLGHVASLARATQLHGACMFEFRQRGSESILLEVNARFWGSLPLAIQAGADFPAMLHDLLVHDKAPANLRYRAGVRLDDLSAEYYRIQAKVHAAPARLGKLAAFASELPAALPSLVSGRSFDSYALDDPQPFRHERRQVSASFGRGIVKRLPPPLLRRSARAKRRIRQLWTAHPGGARLLVVGERNVSRSAFAELLLRAKLGTEVSSASIVAAEGKQPHPNVVAAAAELGVDLAGHRSRPLDLVELRASDAVLVFDYQSIDAVNQTGIAVPILKLPDLVDLAEIPEPADEDAGQVRQAFARIRDAVTVVAAEVTATQRGVSG